MPVLGKIGTGARYALEVVRIVNGAIGPAAPALIMRRFGEHSPARHPRLRVVDASVFPRIPGFFIVTAIYMAAEKASSAILADAAGPPVAPARPDLCAVLTRLPHPRTSRSAVSRPTHVQETR